MLPEVRTGLRRRLQRVRRSLWAIAQTALAAAIAWALAGLVNDAPFFAPISAVISLGVARGRRTVRAVELVLGVAVGIAVADLIVLALGTGTLVIALVVGLAMAAALLLGAGTILVNQAAVSAILVATLTPPSSGISPDRFVDALIGGAVAPARRAGPAAARPAAQPGRRGRPGRGRPRAGARGRLPSAGGGRRGRRRAARSRWPVRWRAICRPSSTPSRSHARRSPCCRGAHRASACRVYAAAAQQLDAAVRNTLVLTRRVLATVQRDGAASAPLAEGVTLLGEAVRELGRALEEPGHEVAVRRLALRAAAIASTVLAQGPGCPPSSSSARSARRPSISCAVRAWATTRPARRSKPPRRRASRPRTSRCERSHARRAARVDRAAPLLGASAHGSASRRARRRARDRVRSRLGTGRRRRPARAGDPGAAGIGDPLFPRLGNGGYDVLHYELRAALRDERAGAGGRRDGPRRGPRDTGAVALRPRLREGPLWATSPSTGVRPPGGATARSSSSRRPARCAGGRSSPPACATSRPRRRPRGQAS
jgi:hypothetical protein